ncbi:MAG: TonB-dependent receptor, partial [Proteobacteria bacterium]|nr:TonB-dependent receptor [Pseudomonadota bacterium]
SHYFELVNLPRLWQPPHAEVSGQLRWESDNGRWNASAWVKNLTNAFYYTIRGDLMSGFGLDYNHISAPRTFGVSVGTRF